MGQNESAIPYGSQTNLRKKSSLQRGDEATGKTPQV